MHGHITSLAVARTHRKLGIATRLMQASRASTPPAYRDCVHAPQLFLYSTCLDGVFHEDAAHHPLDWKNACTRCMA